MIKSISFFSSCRRVSLSDNKSLFKIMTQRMGYTTQALPTYPKFEGNFLIVGWGTVARASLPLILRHFGVTPKNITVVTADEAGKEVALKEGITHIVKPLTTENSRSVLYPLLKQGDLLLNLSVDVSSVELAKLALDKGCLYMDTCVEPAEGGYTTGTLGDRTNYAQREKAIALRSKYPKGSPTALFAHGINPGLISSILKQALLNIASETNLPYNTPTNRTQWAELMHRLGVRVIHIAERDTQVTKYPKKPNQFFNTWSVEGFISEGVFQPAELGWGTHEREFPADGARQTNGLGAAIYLSRPGAATKVRTWTPIEQHFHGFLVTHNESVSIAEYFSVYEGSKCVFRPTVHYAYHPCDAAVQSVHEILGKDSEKQKELRVVMDEVVDGHDELGVLVMGHKKGAYWYGSVLDVHEARRLAPYNNATSLQVASGVLAGLVHCVENPREGVIEAEELNHVRALEVAKPYLGRMVGEYTDWTPIKNYNEQLFTRPVDLSDPWQFKNFRVF
eukprot:TRINITY_DN1378_c0_g2_i3.p1 TRINITY_DN1378_c0_g2~~TRINITY_DN1378_c0_g2_i3.p1  ORF type:complete len:507 (-),score=87.24 TRINITY_DN1378_c0_g2_i3:187-1707(-)